MNQNCSRGPGPFTLKPSNDFSILEEKGLDVSLAKPVLIPAMLHKVTGILKGPGEDEISRWVLNVAGLHILQEFELLDRFSNVESCESGN